MSDTDNGTPQSHAPRGEEGTSPSSPVADAAHARDQPTSTRWPRRAVHRLWRALSWPMRKARRVRWRTVAVRLIAYGFLTFVLVTATALLSVKVFVQADDIRRWVIELVEEQTGGRLDIGKVRFDVLSGLTLEAVQFYPPAKGDSRGSRAGGAVDPIALANFDALAIRFSLAKLAAGKIYVQALQLVEPQLHLRESDGVFNFEGIVDYRAHKFPAEAPVVETAPSGDSQVLAKASFALNPSLAYMPVELLAHNIGIKNLRVDLVKQEKDRIARFLVTNGLNLELGMHWHGAQSRMWLSLASPIEQPLELMIQDAARESDGTPSLTMVDTLTLRTALALRAELADLRKVSLDYAQKVLLLKTPHAGFEDLAAMMRARLAFADSYKTIQIDGIDFDLAEAIVFGLAGKLAVADYDAEQISLKLSQRFALDLGRAAVLARPFLPGFDAGGVINADELEIEGTLETAKLAKAAEGFAVPYVWGGIWIEDVWAELPGTGVHMQPISGDVQISAGPAMNNNSSQFDIDVELLVPEAGVRQKLAAPVGAVSASVSDLTLKLTTRALWPEMIAPIFKLGIEAEAIRAQGDKIAPFAAPLFVDIDADGRGDLQRMGLRAVVELAELAEITALIDCQNRCARLRSNLQVRLDSLEKLHAIALPIGTALGFGAFMPSSLQGAVDFQFASRGKLPDPLTTPPATLIAESDVKFNAQLNLTHIDVKAPPFDVDIKGLDTRLLMGGSTKSQKIELSQKVDRAKVSLPSAQAAGPLMKADISRFSFDTQLENEIAGALNINDVPRLLKSLTTAVQSNLFVGKIAVTGMEKILPRPISGIQAGVAISQSKLTDIKIDEISARVPDFGVNFQLKADARVGADFMPTRAAAELLTQIQHTGAEPLPMGLRTSGGVKLRLATASDDMKVFTLDGETAFDKFNLTLPAADPKASPLATVEEINGSIPFKQVLDLPALEQIGEEVKRRGLAAVFGLGSSPTLPSAATKGPLGDELGDPKAQERERLEQAMGKYLAKTEDKIKQKANLVAIVDYGAVRPFFPERKPLSIRKIEAANLLFEKLEFDMELRQNWFAINQFLIGFLGGKIQGDFQFAFDPLPRRLRTSLHLTRLDTRKILERFPQLKGGARGFPISLSDLGVGNPYIDATVHFEFDVRSRDMNGGIEISSIGGEQLKMLLAYVDPEDVDPSISKIRLALSLGAPSHVSIPIKNGALGLDVEVRAFANLVPIPLPKLQGIPASQLIANVQEGLVAKSEAAQVESDPLMEEGADFLPPPPAEAPKVKADDGKKTSQPRPTALTPHGQQKGTL